MGIEKGHHYDLDHNKRYKRWAPKLRMTPLELQEAMDIRHILKLGIIPIYSIVARLVEGMNRKFEENIKSPPTNKRMLCGSTANIDAVSYLKTDQDSQQKIDNALEDAVEEAKNSGKSRDDVISEILKIVNEPDQKKLPPNVKTKAEVIGFILRTFNHNGGRIKVADLEASPGSGKKLLDWIETTFGVETTKVGGAAAQISDLLHQLGEPNVIMHSQFSSPEQITAFNNNPSFLVINDDGGISIVTREKVTKDNDPTKTNQVIERSANILINFEGEQILASEKADRFIFLSEYYDDGHIIQTDPVLPFSDKVLIKLSDTKNGENFEFFFTTTPTYLQRCKNNEEYLHFSDVLSGQFKILKEKGVKILYEFSGETSDIRYLKDVLKNNISSFSLNHAELVSLLEEIKINDDINMNVEEGDKPINIYNNAVTLAKYLGVERLHVHGYNIDISVRKSATKEIMEAEVNSLMYAKKVVVQWIRGVFSNQHSGNDVPSKLLKREGFIDFLNFAHDLSKKYFLEESDYKQRATLIFNLIKNGFHQVDNDYSVAIIPSKWVYDEVKVTTSSGDIMAILAAYRARYE